MKYLIFQQEQTPAPEFKAPWPVVIDEQGKVIHGRPDADWVIAFGEKGSYSPELFTRDLFADPGAAVGLVPTFQANGDMFLVDLPVIECRPYEVEDVSRLVAQEQKFRDAIGRA
jgi:hypothetical protein